jgi:hypothetical protein
MLNFVTPRAFHFNCRFAFLLILILCGSEASPSLLPVEKKMKTSILIGLTAFGLAACSVPTLNGRSDTAQLLSGDQQGTYRAGPYDNTANSAGGRYVGGGD